MNDLGGFRLWLAQGGRKGSTIRLVSQTIERVLRNVETLTSDSILSYLLGQKKAGKHGRYLNNIVAALHLYGQYKNILYLRSIKRFKNEAFYKSTMSDEEIERFLALPCPVAHGKNWNTGKSFVKRTDPDGWEMWRVFWTICAFSGTRMGEVAHLAIHHIDFGRGVFVIEEGKQVSGLYR